MIRILCYGLCISALLVNEIIDGGTSPSTCPTENPALAIINDTSSFSTGKPPHPTKITRGDKEEQAHNVNDALEEAIAIEAFWFGYGE